MQRGCCASTFGENLLTIRCPALVCSIAHHTTGEHPEFAMAYHSIHPVGHLTQDVIGSNLLTHADAACIARARKV